MEAHIPAYVGLDSSGIFVGEGAANIVFDVRKSDGQPVFPGELLRVPKAGKPTYSYQELQDYWEALPTLRRDRLVKQRLVRLLPDMIQELNRVVEAMDLKQKSSRRQDFKNEYVAQVEYGMLVEDMRAVHPGDITIEFKPKWLSELQTAFPDPKRCRNCAREAFRANKNGVSFMPRGSALPPSCPLVLVEEEALDMNRYSLAIRAIVPPAHYNDALAYRLVEWFKDDDSVLRTLRSVQTDMDKQGFSLADNMDAIIPEDGKIPPVLEGLALNFTLRDCTCFLLIPGDPAHPIVAKLGDLDRKNVRAKLKSWQTMERTLQEDGYYSATENPRQTARCKLEAYGDLGSAR